MTLNEAILARHSVRQYKDIPLSQDIIDELNREIEICNNDGDLHFQLITNEPKAFSGFMAHYGSFRGVKNYFALVGKDCDDLYEKCGYFGEKLVLKAQQLGLNTCWVALTYSKVPGAYEILPGEKLTVVISVGYGETQGKPRKSKTSEEVSNLSINSPTWFKNGIEAVLLAPTAVNQQKFYFEEKDGMVLAKRKLGASSKMVKMDLGIAKLHFEIGAGKENFTWK